MSLVVRPLRMNAKVFSNWAGLASIIWMLFVYVLVFLVIGPLADRYDFAPGWLFMLTVLAGWLGVGLLLVVVGLRCGSWIGRVCAILGLIVFLYFAWMFWLSPALTRPHQRAMRSNNALQATAAVLCGWEADGRHNAVVAGASAPPAAVPELGR